MSDDIEIPLRRGVIKVLGCPVGSKEYSEELLTKTVETIENSLKVLLDFPQLHLRSKLAQFCNTKITDFLLAKYPEVGVDTLEDLDVAFKDFYAHSQVSRFIS